MINPNNYIDCSTVFELLREVEKTYKNNIPNLFIELWKALTNYYNKVL